MGIGNQALQNRGQLIEDPGSQGLLGSLAPGIGSALGSFLGPLGTAAGGALGTMAGNWLSGNGNAQKGTTSPYGGQSPQVGSSGLPNFSWNKR